MAKNRTISSSFRASKALCLTLSLTASCFCSGSFANPTAAADIAEPSKTQAKVPVKAASKEPIKDHSKEAAKPQAVTQSKEQSKEAAKPQAASQSKEQSKEPGKNEVTKEPAKRPGKEQVKGAATTAAQATDSKAPAAKAADGAKGKTAATVTKSDGKAQATVSHARPRPSPMLVPPPPPDTPTMIPSFGDETSGLMPMEYMSPELLKKRKQDLVAQLLDAKADLKGKQDGADTVRQKAGQFKTLFEEGVISKRELETAQKDAGEVDSSINRAQLRVSELQTLLDGVNGRWDQLNKKTKTVTTIKKISAKPHKNHRVTD